jgi:hypothetical protein
MIKGQVMTAKALSAGLPKVIRAEIKCYARKHLSSQKNLIEIK